MTPAKIFQRRKATSIEHGPVYIHELVIEGVGLAPGEKAIFSITASRSGIKLDGVLHLGNQSELRDFAKLISDAFKDHQKLKPHLSATPSGH